MKYLFVKLNNHRFINLNYLMDFSFSKEKDENDEICYECRLKFIDGIREEFMLSEFDFNCFYQEVSNALV